MQRYFYLKQQGQILGPFEAAKLLQMYRSGILAGTDQVSPDKISWQSAEEFFAGNSVPVTPVVPVIPPPVAPRRHMDTRTFETGAPTIRLQAEDINPPPAEESLPETEPAEDPACFSAGGFGKIAAVLFLLTLLAGGGLWLFHYLDAGKTSASSETKQDQEKNEQKAAPKSGTDNWKAVVQQNEEAVGVVLLEVIDKNGNKGFFPQGTAWANSKNTFVTNAHVAATFYGCLNYSDISSVNVYVAMNRGKKRHLIHAIQIHPDYRNVKSEINDSDFAILHTHDTLATYLTCGAEKELRRVQQGDEVIFLGFPMEGLHKKNLNIDCPMATLQKGHITSITDIDSADGGYEKNTLIKHNLPTVGGASGSPIFAVSGHVIAILFAGNMNFEFDSNGKMRKREASAAMINFAIRIDRLQQCQKSELIDIESFMKGD